MLLPENVHPENSLYFNGAFVLKTLNASREARLIDLYFDTQNLRKIPMPIFVLALDWLFLAELVGFNANGNSITVNGTPQPINISVENANNAGTIFIFGDYFDDSLTGSAGRDILEGKWGNDVLVGNAGNDVLRGGVGNDTLLGGAGNDFLYGDVGDDTLTGGADNDTFGLRATIQVDNVYGFGVDTITDFVSGLDKIVFDFTVLNDGMSIDGLSIDTLSSADALVQGDGAVALDANDHFIFDTATGALYYDSDGNGANEALQLAILQGVTQLSVDDFTMSLTVQMPLCYLPDPIVISLPIDFVPGCQGVSIISAVAEPLVSPTVSGNVNIYQNSNVSLGSGSLSLNSTSSNFAISVSSTYGDGLDLIGVSLSSGEFM